MGTDFEKKIRELFQLSSRGEGDQAVVEQERWADASAAPRLTEDIRPGGHYSPLRSGWHGPFLLRVAKGTPPSCKPSRESRIAGIISENHKSAKYFPVNLADSFRLCSHLGLRIKVTLREVANPLTIS